MPSPALPFAAACIGIAIFSGMDAVMKQLAIDLGAYNAMLWRVTIGAAITALPWAIMRAPWPSRAGMRVHALRGLVGAVMATCFFYGLARVPMAEGIALTFIAPLIALFLAAVLLGERIGPASIIGSLIAFAGVAVLIASRLGGSFAAGSGWGVAAILASALLYAWNIILMRQQALVASPIEVAFFQYVWSAAWLALAALGLALFPHAPVTAELPPVAALPMLVVAAGFAMVSLFLLSWAYGRAEARLLVPVEYTAFVWAAILGAVIYRKALTATTIAGAALIISGCIVGARAKSEPFAEAVS